MKGFIKKDLLFLKGSLKLYALICVLYIIMVIQGEIDISALLPFFSMMLMFTTFNYDAFNNWDAYATTLPKGRENIVKAKYTVTVLLALVVSLFVLILGYLISYFQKQPFNLTESLNIILIVNGVTFLIESIMYPIVYKMGIEKARIAIFLVVFGIVIIAGACWKFIDFNNFADPSHFLQHYGAILFLGGALIILAISFWISKKIYLKKEF